MNWKYVSGSKSATHLAFTLPLKRRFALPLLASALIVEPCAMVRTAERSTIVAEKSSARCVLSAFTTATASTFSPSCRYASPTRPVKMKKIGVLLDTVAVELAVTAPFTLRLYTSAPLRYTTMPARAFSLSSYASTSATSVRFTRRRNSCTLCATSGASLGIAAHSCAKSGMNQLSGTVPSAR